MGSRGRMLSVAEYARFWRALVEGLLGLPRTGGTPQVVGLSRARVRAWRAASLVGLLGEAGLRVSEACALRWEYLHVARGGVATVWLPAGMCKGLRAREIVLTPALRWLLAWWWNIQAGGAVAGRCGFVLAAWPDGERLGVRGAQASVSRLGWRFLGRHVGCHDLRRTYGDRVRQVADVRIAQLMLGHQRLASTERYLGGSRAERMEAARSIDYLLPGADRCGEAIRGWAPMEWAAPAGKLEG